MTELEPPETGKLADGGENEATVQFGEFSYTHWAAPSGVESLTVMLIVPVSGEEDELDATEKGTVTEVVEEAVPDVALVKETGEAEDTLQMHPVVVK